MTVTTSTLTATFYDASGVPLEGVVVTAVLKGIDLQTKQYVVEDVQTATSGVDGIATLELFANASGTRLTYYRITAVTPDGTVVSDSNVSIPSTDCDLADVEGNWSGEIFTGGSNATVSGTLTVTGFTTLSGYSGAMSNGTIDNVAVGGSTPAAGSFTQLTGTTGTINGNLTVTGSGQINGSATIGDAPGDSHTINGEVTLAGTINGLTLPTTTDTVVTLNSSQTLTNKTLTTPTISNPTMSGTTANLGTVTTIDINGGTIDGTVIGGSSAAAITGTSIVGTSLNIGTGALTAGTGTFSATGDAISAGGAATTNRNIRIANTGGDLRIGVEASPINIVTGATAYDSFISTQNATGLTIGINNSKVARFDGNGLSLGSLALTAGSGTFSSSASGQAVTVECTGVGTTDYGELRVVGGTTNARLSSYSQGHSTRANQVWLNTTSASSNVVVGVNSSAVATFSSTGLAVSGVLSAIGASSQFDICKRSDSTRAYSLYSASGELNFYNGSANTMTLDASGNLGLGVTPSASAACNNFQLGPNGDTISSRILANTPQFAISSNAVGNWYAPTYKVNGYATQYTQQGYDGTHRWYIAASGTAGNAISWLGGTAAMTLDASGNLSVATGSITATSGYVKVGTYLWAAGTSSGQGLYLGTGTANGLIAQQSNGTGTTTTYIGNQAITTSSDRRLKANIKPTERNALDLLGQWEIVDHTWDDPSDQCENNRNSRGVWTGVVAQQVQPITPWLVNKPTEDTNEDGSINPWTMDFGYAVPLLVKAIQDQQAQIAALEARLAALESK